MKLKYKLVVAIFTVIVLLTLTLTSCIPNEEQDTSSKQQTFECTTKCIDLGQGIMHCECE